MPNNIKIISVLTFGILTLHSHLHANEICNGHNNPINNKEFRSVDDDLTNVKDTTLAVQNPKKRGYRELYPDYNAETLEDFLQENSWVGVIGNKFTRFFDGKPSCRKRRCPSRICKNYLRLASANNGKKRKVRGFDKYLSNRNNKSTSARPWNKLYEDLSTTLVSNTKSKESNSQSTTFNILFPMSLVKSEVPLFNNSGVVFSKTDEYKVFPKMSSSAIEMDLIGSYYNSTEGEKIPIPNLMPLTTNFFRQLRPSNKTYGPLGVNKSAKSSKKGELFPAEKYLFETTTFQVLNVKESLVTNPLYSSKNQINSNNQSRLENNECSFDFEKEASKKFSTVPNLPQNNNTYSKTRGQNVGDRDVIEWNTKNNVAWNVFNNISEASLPINKYGQNPSVDANLNLTTTLGAIVSANNPVENADSENRNNCLEQVNKNQDKTLSKNQLEALFVSEKNYKIYEKDFSSVETSKSLKEKSKEQKSNSCIYTTEKSNIIPQYKESRPKKETKDTEKLIRGGNIGCGNNITGVVNSSCGVDNYRNSESSLTNNQNVSAETLHKRLACEKNPNREGNYLLKNVYDDYDYYFFLGDNNNTDESPFQNGNRAINLRRQKNLAEKLHSNKNLTPTATKKLEKSKNVTFNQKTRHIPAKKTTKIQNAVKNTSTTSPNIIKKLWPNVGNKDKLSLQEGKNYILNLFRKQGGGSKMKHLTSSTTQAIGNNFFFNKRSNDVSDELIGIDQYEIMENMDTKFGDRKKRNISNKVDLSSSSELNALSPLESSKKCVRQNKKCVKHDVENLNDPPILQNSIFDSNDRNYLKNINDVLEIFQNLEREKRMANKSLPLSLLPFNKHRRSIFSGEMEDYNTKFQNLQKDLLELQKAISSPKAGRSGKNEEKNLTLQIRVIVDVVNNTVASTENPEEEPLKKRDTKLVEKKSNVSKVDIPMPLEHESPLAEEKKGTDVWRNKRVDGAVDESPNNNLPIFGENSYNGDLSDDIIKNITYLLDNLLENFKFQNGDGKKNKLDQTITDNPEYSDDQKFKRSFIHLKKSQHSNKETQAPPVAEGYKFNTLFEVHKKQSKNNFTLANNENLIMEINKSLPSKMLELLKIRNRRSTNERKFTEYNKKLFEDDINALYTIVENIKNKLAHKKIMDSIEDEDSLLDNVDPFLNTGTTWVIPFEGTTWKGNEMGSQVTKISLIENDAKVKEILETIGNIGEELKKIDLKEKTLREIIDPENKNDKEGNKIKVIRKKNYVTMSSHKLNKALYSKCVRNILHKRNKRIKNNVIHMNVKKKTTLPPCCIPSTVDEGHHLNIEWCCPNELDSSLVTPGSSAGSITELSTDLNGTSSQNTEQTKEEIKTSSENLKIVEESTPSSFKFTKTAETSTASYSTTSQTVTNKRVTSQTTEEGGRTRSPTQTTAESGTRSSAQTTDGGTRPSTQITTESRTQLSTQTTEEGGSRPSTQITAESGTRSSTQTKDSTEYSTLRTTKKHKKRNHNQSHYVYKKVFLI